MSFVAILLFSRKSIFRKGRRGGRDEKIWGDRDRGEGGRERKVNEKMERVKYRPLKR